MTGAISAREAMRFALNDVSTMLRESLSVAVNAAAEAVEFIAVDDDPIRRFEAGRILLRAFNAIDEVAGLARGQLVALEIVPDGGVR